MKRSRSLFFVLVISALLASNFNEKLFAQNYNKFPTNNRGQQVFQIQEYVDSKENKETNSFTSKKDSISDTEIDKKSENIIYKIIKNLWFGIASLITISTFLKYFFQIDLQDYLKTTLTFWKFTEVSKDIKKYQKIFKATIYNDSELPIHVITTNVNKDLKSCLKAKERYFNSGMNERINFRDIARIFLEKKLLAYRDFSRKIFEDKIEEKSSSSALLKEYFETIEIDNIFTLLNQTEGIVNYLQLHKFENDSNDPAFYSNIKIRNGFVAPLYLIAGPLRYFEEDWPKIIREYNCSFAQTSNDLKEFQRIKLSNFTTWIAWGPSIPICTCNKWKYDSNGETDALITFQCGFGDENNSVPLLISREHKNQYQEYLNNNHNSSMILKETDLMVKPTLLSKKKITKFATAQKEFIDLKHDELILTNSNNINPSRPDPEDYYSAYLWILFGINQDSNLFNDLSIIDRINNNKFDTSTIYRNVLPFFEHINIASPDVYETYKQVFVRKILEFIRRNSNHSRSFVYLCAFDDCNCETTNQLLGHFPGEKIKEILHSLIKPGKEYEDLQNSIVLERSSVLPACDLPSLICRFNEDISKK